ncbi:MAG TPA: protein translocase subunit SecD [Candidatus Saccharimonadales bacterium]|nr:protein translocase subunit SecD [Candidatus Saccharimonadales bacterium]
MKHPRFLLAIVFLVTIISVFLNLTQSFQINVGPIHKKFPGLSLNSIPGVKINRSFAFRKGLDLEGGTSITLKADMKGIPQSQQQNAIDSAKSVIEKRINPAGVSEAVVQTVKVNKDFRIIVEIPGVTDVNQALELVGKTAKLSFWEEGSGSASESAKKATNSAELIEQIKTASGSGVPLGVAQLLGPDAKKTNLTGSDLKQATVVFDQNSGKPEVGLSFSPDGSKKFADITKRNVGKIVAIALDNIVMEAPRVNEPIFGGSAVITGSFTTQQANTLQRQLNAGALPVSLSVLEQKATGATLGEASLQKSLLAGAIGFVVVVVFMIVLYGRLGFIACLALVVYMLLVLSLFRLIPVTLTLAGIAGFILSIGVAVDANILIFERMKEEMRRGISHESAIDLGFSRAWPSIRDSNVSSLITSSILYYFGTTIVRGFAFTLALGVIVSMFSAIVVTRTFLRLLYRN